jgi:nitrite reductase [NAD(P)H] small subunit
MAEATATPINLGSISRIPVGQGRCYVIGSDEIAVFRQRDGRLFATQNRCPHRQGPLSEGVIGGGRVICPLHAHRFNLKNGAGSEPDECVQVHQVTNVDGEIRLRLRPPLPNPSDAKGGGVQCEPTSGEDQTA